MIDIFQDLWKTISFLKNYFKFSVYEIIATIEWAVVL